MNLYAVIPSIDRDRELSELVTTLLNDDVHPIVIDTGYPYPGPTVAKYDDVTMIRDSDQPVNISRWWNRGLDAASNFQLWSNHENSEYVVAVLNDDIVVPSGFVQRLADAIMKYDAAAAYPSQHGFLEDLVHTYAGPISLYRRMTGYAFALRGSKQIRADETLQWWYGDDDIDWTARQRGGSVLVGALSVEHLYPNSTTSGELAEQAGRDRQTFINKWGRAPW